MAFKQLPNAFPALKPTPEIKITKSGKKGNLLILILDESGSMSGVHNDTLMGVNGLLASQRTDPIKSFVKIVTFEGGSVRTVRNSHIDNTPDLSRADYTPRGGTNLLDAIGQTLLEASEYLKQFRSDRRPSVIFQITTDGEENSSRSFSFDKIKSLISKATEAGWVFSFVGAGIDSFKVSGSLGIAAAATSNYSHATTRSTYDAMGTSMGRMKKMMADGTTNEQLYATASVYTDDERLKMGDKK